MMYKEYFVFISEKYFGVFRLDAKDYPEEFNRNPQNIHVVEGYQLAKFLINSIGRNILIYHDFIFPHDIGKLFLIHPKN